MTKREIFRKKAKALGEEIVLLSKMFNSSSIQSSVAYHIYHNISLCQCRGIRYTKVDVENILGRAISVSEPCDYKVWENENQKRNYKEACSFLAEAIENIYVALCIKRNREQLNNALEASAILVCRSYGRYKLAMEKGAFREDEMFNRMLEYQNEFRGKYCHLFKSLESYDSWKTEYRID